MRPLITTALVKGMTWTTWRKRNRLHVVAMAQSGLSADEIVDAHATDAENRGHVEIVMSWLQDRIARGAVPQERPAPPGSSGKGYWSVGGIWCDDTDPPWLPRDGEDVSETPPCQRMPGTEGAIAPYQCPHCRKERDERDELDALYAAHPEKAPRNYVHTIPKELRR